VVFSTHVMQHAERICDRVVLIAGGRKVFDGSVAEARSAAPRTLVLEGAIPETAARELPGLEDPIWEAIDDGGRLSARLKAGAAAQGPLQAAFARGWEISRFELKEPSLHDAFIRLAGGGASS
jgi:ABC-2 type transport system ATP-binding protein